MRVRTDQNEDPRALASVGRYLFGIFVLSPFLVLVVGSYVEKAEPQDVIGCIVAKVIDVHINEPTVGALSPLRVPSAGYVIAELPDEKRITVPIYVPIKADHSDFIALLIVRGRWTQTDHYQPASEPRCPISSRP